MKSSEDKIIPEVVTPKTVLPDPGKSMVWVARLEDGKEVELFKTSERQFERTYKHNANFQLKKKDNK